ncbi:MAG TPA: flagellin [Clostridia bacterium]|nr:flagellin [Clostridia bacterium]
MRINHNIAALNTYNQLSKNNETANSALKKLSSGLRINQAGDDPAGMAISEKMRAQINGLNQANRNAQDGISLIQTAEGALNETTSILQRMRELAVQAGNDTATANDRATIQAEMDQLAQEITRIADTTKFNGEALMSSSHVFSGNLQIGADAGQTLDVQLTQMDALTIGVGIGSDAPTLAAAEYTDVAGTFSADGGTIDTAGYTTNLQSLEITFDVVTVGNGTDTAGTANVTVNGTSVLLTADSVAADGTYTLSHSDFSDIIASGESITIDAGAALEADMVTTITVDALQNGDLAGLDVSSGAAAAAALTSIDSAIDMVSTQRSNLGSYTNRLEYTITNLETASENMTAAESRIRDVDMASEMMEYTKMNVLSQAAQSMLAQANAQPQNVLQLLNS